MRIEEFLKIFNHIVYNSIGYHTYENSAEYNGMHDNQKCIAKYTDLGFYMYLTIGNKTYYASKFDDMAIEIGGKLSGS